MTYIDRRSFRTVRARLYVRYAVAIAATSVTAFLVFFFVVRPFLEQTMQPIFFANLVPTLVEPTLQAGIHLDATTLDRIGNVKPEVLYTPTSGGAVDVTLDYGGTPISLYLDPPPRPPAGPILTLMGILSVFIGLGSAALLVAPLARRLRRLHLAIESVGEARAALRIETSADDVVGQLGLEFNRMAERVERAMRDRDELLQAVSHEIGTPLARLRVLIASLENEGSTLAASMIRELGELSSLTKELGDYVAAESPPAVGETSDVALAVREACEIHTGWSRNRLVCLGIDDPVWAACAGRDVQRTIDNLLRNAERHAVGVVQVEVDTGDAMVELRVEDDGVGVPEKERERVFQPFARMDSARNREHGGLGLGLAIVSRLATRAGGDAHVTASRLGGARFVVRWPRARTVPTPGQAAGARGQ